MNTDLSVSVILFKITVFTIIEFAAIVADVTVVYVCIKIIK